MKFFEVYEDVSNKREEKVRNKNKKLEACKKKVDKLKVQVEDNKKIYFSNLDDETEKTLRDSEQQLEAAVKELKNQEKDIELIKEKFRINYSKEDIISEFLEEIKISGLSEDYEVLKTKYSELISISNQIIDKRNILISNINSINMKIKDLYMTCYEGNNLSIELSNIATRQLFNTPHIQAIRRGLQLKIDNGIYSTTYMGIDELPEKL